MGSSVAMMACHSSFHSYPQNTSPKGRPLELAILRACHPSNKSTVEPLLKTISHERPTPDKPYSNSMLLYIYTKLNPSLETTPLLILSFFILWVVLKRSSTVYNACVWPALRPTWPTEPPYIACRFAPLPVAFITCLLNLVIRLAAEHMWIFSKIQVDWRWQGFAQFLTSWNGCARLINGGVQPRASGIIQVKGCNSSFYLWIFTSTWKQNGVHALSKLALSRFQDLPVGVDG